MQIITSQRIHAPTWLGAISVALVGTAIYGWVASYASTIGGFTDAMDYLFIADFYRSWFRGEPVDELAQFYRVTRFPPLYSMMLGALGAGSEQRHLASMISAITAVLAGLAVFWWIKRERGAVLPATLIGLALLLYPAYFLLNLYPVSEPLAIALVAIAFGLLATPHITGPRLLVAGLIIGIAPLVRTALLPAIPALIIWIAMHRPAMLPQRLMAIGVAAAPIAGWMAYRSALGSHSYADYLDPSQMLAALGGWPAALWIQPGRLFMAAVDNWGSSISPLPVVATALLTGFSAAGCVLRMRAGHIDGWFLAGYIALILIWPFPDEFGRFIVLIYPCLLLSALTAAKLLDERLRATRSGRAGATPALALTLALATAATAVPYAVRASVEVDDILLGDKREASFFRAETDEDAVASAGIYGRMRLLIAEIHTVIPKGACVYSVVPQMLRLHGGLVSMPYPEGIEKHPDPESLLRICDYYFIAALNVSSLDDAPLHPWPLIKDWISHRPLLVSEIVVRGEEHTVAALLERRQPAVADPLPPDED